MPARGQTLCALYWYCREGLRKELRGRKMNIYVGNLSYGSTEETIRGLFEAHGTVDSVSIIMDRNTGRSRGFGFVEMPNDDEAKAAIAELDNKDFEGRQLRVNEARPKPERKSNYESW
jgi:cold-inducible RNA-binding protein